MVVSLVPLACSKLGEVEGVFSLKEGEVESLSHNLSGAVVWQFQVVDACHDRGKEVIGTLGCLHGLSDNGEGWVESSES